MHNLLLRCVLDYNLIEVCPLTFCFCVTGKIVGLLTTAIGSQRYLGKNFLHLACFEDRLQQGNKTFIFHGFQDNSSFDLLNFLALFQITHV